MVENVTKNFQIKDAASAISEEYARLRSVADVSEGSAKTIPITARTLETLIRLSTAHAKCRLSKKVEAQDAEVAIELIQFAYFAKVGDIHFWYKYQQICVDLFRL